MKKHPNVFRIDIEPDEEHPDRHATHGWQVRVRRQGMQHTKFFSESRYGGRDGALEEALEYRDQLLEELPEPDDPTRRSAEARSKTGVVGLNFCMKDDGSGTRKPYIQLSWMTKEGKRRGASYSIDKWGLRRGIWNACVRLHREHRRNGQRTPPPDVMFETAFENIIDEYEEELESTGVMPSETTPSRPTPS